MRFRNRFLLSLSIAASLPASWSAAQPLGTFTGRVVTEWLVETGEDRHMRLLEDFAYRAPNGAVWAVPKGHVIDGASIPRLLWTYAGSPFTGDYRRASVIHDYYCDKKNRAWKAVHRVFYEASRADGVPEAEAKKLYAAVYAFGPRWELLSGTGFEDPSAKVVTYVPRFSDSVNEIESWITADSPTLEQIEQRIDAAEIE